MTSFRLRLRLGTCTLLTALLLAGCDESREAELNREIEAVRAELGVVQRELREAQQENKILRQAPPQLPEDVEEGQAVGPEPDPPEVNPGEAGMEGQ
jgi:hypothetical protein